MKLSESQEATIDRLGKPLHPVDRQRYRQRVAELLDRREFGDGVVARAAAQAQREVMTAPPPRPEQGSKWGRRAGAK